MAIDTNKSDHWALELDAVLRAKNDSVPQLVFTNGQEIHGQFDHVIAWVGEGIAPILSMVAKLRGEETQSHKNLLNLAAAWSREIKFGADEWGPCLHQVFVQHARHAFAYDRAYSFAYDSALDFAEKNQEMIVEHFGSSEDYAEYYAETDTDATIDFHTRTVGNSIGQAVTTAFVRQDVDLFAASFPAAILRGLMASYEYALGPMSQAELAADLHKKLQNSIQR